MVILELNELNRAMQSLISNIDMMNENCAEATVEAVTDAARIIVGEQKRLIRGKSSKLASLIKADRIVITKKGMVQVKTGYDTKAIKSAPHAVVYEFGRPGKKAKAKGGKDSRGRKIGKIEPINHVRKGADNKRDEATKVAIERLEEIIKW